MKPVLTYLHRFLEYDSVYIQCINIYHSVLHIYEHCHGTRCEMQWANKCNIF